MSTNLPSKDQIQDVNRTIGQLNVPWTDLFDAIEANSNGDVALLDVEPLASARIVHVTAECAGSDDMIEYLNGFMRNGYFTSVSLKQHQVQVTNGARTLRFWFDLGWAAGADQANAS